MTEYVLQARQINKIYNKQAVLRQVDLTIPKGSIYGFIGQNGAGKTTFMRIVAGLAQASSGEIELFGRRQGAGLVEARRRMGAAIEAQALFPHMTAVENLEVFRLQKGIRDKGRVRKVLQLVDLSDTGKKPSFQFSLGMKQRLGLAIALLGEPELLILDEPSNGLDPVAMIELRELLLRLNREHGVTILISSHILSELNLLATDYGIIHQGCMVEQLQASELQARCMRYLSIRTDDAASAARVLQEHWSGTRVEQTRDGTLRLHGSPVKPAMVARLLLEAGLELEELTPKGEELEEYYKRRIGEAEHG